MFRSTSPDLDEKLKEARTIANNAEAELNALMQIKKDQAKAKAQVEGKNYAKAQAPVPPVHAEDFKQFLTYASEGKINAMEALLKKYPDFAKNNDSEGTTALAVAARENKPDVVEFLVKKGCSTKVIDGSGMTAMMIAAKKDNVEVINALLKMGAKAGFKPSVGPHKGETAYGLADILNTYNLLYKQEEFENSNARPARNNNANANNNNAAPPPQQAGLSNEARLAEKQAALKKLDKDIEKTQVALAAQQASRPGLVAEIYGIKQEIRNKMAADLEKFDKELEAAPRNGVAQNSGGALTVLYAAAMAQEEPHSAPAALSTNDNNNDDDSDADDGLENTPREVGEKQPPPPSENLSPAKKPRIRSILR